MAIENNKARIDFEIPGGESRSLLEVIYEILRDNNLWPPKKEDLKNLNSGESYAITIRDAAVIMYKKRIPEEKIVELLQKHLKTSPETTQKIIVSIKQRILPYAREVSPNDNTTKKDPLSNTVKKVDVADVEKNAEELQRKRDLQMQENSTGQELSQKKIDQYREPLS